ncbi:hypothetical protein [Streptomyces sp. NPDC088182]|uniref:hypothetical protein n=1 Tax=Streptomyces sp. NPDC088182 TaxID=3365838 RepID=UPI003827B2CC
MGRRRTDHRPRGPELEPTGPTAPAEATVRRVLQRVDGTQVHLLAAMTGTGLVTAQGEVDGRTNENRLHHLRDTAWTEDASRVRTGAAP